MQMLTKVVPAAALLALGFFAMPGCTTTTSACGCTTAGHVHNASCPCGDSCACTKDGSCCGCTDKESACCGSCGGEAKAKACAPGCTKDCCPQA